MGGVSGMRHGAAEDLRRAAAARWDCLSWRSHKAREAFDGFTHFEGRLVQPAGQRPATARMDACGTNLCFSSRR